MRTIEVNHKKSTVFAEPTEALVHLSKMLVPSDMELRHISIDIKGEKLLLMVEEVKDAPTGS